MRIAFTGFIISVTLAVGSAAWASGPAGDEPSSGAASKKPARQKARARLANNTTTAKQAAKELTKLSNAKPPKSASKKEREAFGQQAALFKRTVTKLRQLAAKSDKLLERAKKEQADLVLQMEDLNEQYVALAAQFTTESRRYATVSSALAASHDAAMNSIRNFK